MNCPLLTVALPAYCYQEGIARILATLPSMDPRIEVIVGDDTPDETLGNWLQGSAISKFGNQLRYHRNTPSLGAVPNWNDLIRRATGKYVWLLHHDECPVDESAVNRLLSLLDEAPDLDVVLLDLVLVLGGDGLNRRHLPNTMRALVVKIPHYLLRRNMIGPPSAIVVRRALYDMYDVSLRWLVDVELYTRVLAKARRVCLARDITVLSCPGRPGSITASLHHDISQIERKERAAICDNVSPLGGERKAPVSGEIGFLLGAVESLMWHVFRGLLRLPSWLGISALPRARVREALGRSFRESTG